MYWLDDTTYVSGSGLGLLGLIAGAWLTFGVTGGGTTRDDAVGLGVVTTATVAGGEADGDEDAEGDGDGLAVLLPESDADADDESLAVGPLDGPTGPADVPPS